MAHLRTDIGLETLASLDEKFRRHCEIALRATQRYVSQIGG
jgi:hypothetical protein